MSPRKPQTNIRRTNVSTHSRKITPEMAGRLRTTHTATRQKYALAAAPAVVSAPVAVHKPTNLRLEIKKYVDMSRSGAVSFAAALPRLPLKTNSMLWYHRRWVYSGLGLVVAAGLLATGAIVHSHFQAKRYILSSATQKLVGKPAANLAGKLSYDAKQARYRYNPAAANGIKPASGGDNSASFGGSNYYGVDLAKAASKGQTFTDAATKLSFSLMPNFGSLDGRNVNGHIVYPIDAGQAVYTLKDNGLKEDVVLSEPRDAVALSYKLKLPDSLQARLEKDGSVGIYSADPALFGNISYGSDKDQATVEKARKNAQKTNLVFQIPAPIITETGKAVGTGKAAFKLAGDQLTVTANDLSNLSYPISIDPSVVVQSANSFLTNANNDDDNITVGTGSITRSSLTGATVGSWSSAGTLADSGVDVSTAIVNGYIYSAVENSGGSTNETLDFASINATTGAVGTFARVTSGAQYDARESRIVGYNGYLYMIGGFNLTNVVYYTKPAANGDITSWTQATSMNVSRFGFGATAYNGRLYVAGGCSSTLFACNGVTNSVESAVINSDGSLSAWSNNATSFPTLPTAVSGNALVSANGRLYAVGGGDYNGNNAANIYYSVIKADGTLGAWQTTVAMPGGLTTMISTVISGNYLYLIGGGTTSSYVAPIYGGGAVGPFQTTTTLPKKWGQTNGLAYAGKIYLVGGADSNGLGAGNAYADVISSPVSSAGVLGNFVSTGTTFGTSASAATFGSGVVAANGYLYSMGGANNGSGAASNVTRYAAICTGSNTNGGCTTSSAVGSLGTWGTTSANFSGARTSAGASAANGFIYLSGGQAGAITTSLNNVQIGQIQSNGDITSWSTSATFPASGGNDGRFAHGSIILGGYLYLIGGVNNASSSTLKDTVYAAICTGSNTNGGCTTSSAVGSLGTWSQDTTHTLNNGSGSGGLAAFGIVTSGNYIYIFGGTTSSNNTPVNIIQSTQVNTSTGAIGSWTTPSNGLALPNNTARFGLGAFTLNGYIYLNSGADSSATTYKDTWYTALNGATIGSSWSQTTNLVPANPASSTTHNSNNTTGVRQEAGYATYNGYVYVLGGCDTGTNTGCNNGALGPDDNLPDVQYAPINNGGSGNSSALTALSSSITKRYSASGVAYNGYIYILGGSTSSGSFPNDVSYAPINADGTLGTFTSTSQYNGGFLPGVTFAVYNGYMYEVGGNSGGTPSNGVQYALICTGANSGTLGCGSTPGALGTWNFTSNSANTGTTKSGGLNTARFWTQAAAYNGYLYVTGGCNGAASVSTCSSITNSTEIAAINSDGTIGAWSTSPSSFTTARYNSVNLTYNGYLYVVGGCTGLSGGNCNAYANDVQYAKLNGSILAADAGCGTAWCYAPNFTTVRENMAVTALNGYMYVMGGDTTGSTVLGDVQYAPILGNGALGAWQTGTVPLATAVQGASAVGSGGYVYLLGGCTAAISCSSGTTNSGQYMAPQTIGHTARYSKFIDLASTIGGNGDGNPQITRSRIAGSSTPWATGQSAFTVCLSGASTLSTTFASAICSNATLNSKVSTSSYGRYAFVSIIMDDSQSAVFPDTTSSTVTELDIFSHAAPARRLRGGKTFTDMGVQSGTVSNGLPAIQQLDTEGTN